MYATYLPAVYTGSYVRSAQLLAPSPTVDGRRQEP